MSEPLKNCPFCYSVNLEIPYSIYSYEHNKKRYHVLCNNCDSKSGEYDTRELAIEAWNKRADDKYNELVEFLISFVINADCADNVKDCVPCEAYELLRKHGVEV